jgi:putative sigma-54 modulation protein
MEIVVKSRHFEITPALRSRIEKDIQRLVKTFENPNDIHLVEAILSLQKTWQNAEILIQGDGFVVRAEERTHDMYASIDGAIKKIERQLRKFRDKLISKPRERSHGANVTGQPIAPSLISTEAEETASNSEPKIVRVKRFEMKPLSPEEAALQMELLNHNFFVFLNAETHQINVIYRRQDGNYGLIEPLV